jgi:hypothetical protein
MNLLIFLKSLLGKNRIKAFKKYKDDEKLEKEI